MLQPQDGACMFIETSVSAYMTTCCQNQNTTFCIISCLCRQILYSPVLDHRLALQDPYVIAFHDKSILSHRPYNAVQLKHRS
jgi:hypothetical protein